VKLFTAARMRELDRAAIEERCIPSTLLMENAARAVAECALSLLSEPKGKRAAVFCGPGNNGGDGVCAARRLLLAGVATRAFMVGPRARLTEDNREMARRLMEAGGELSLFDPDSEEQAAFCRGADVLVDAIFGIGLHSEVRGGARAAIRLLNSAPAPTVAADIASGVETDSGRVLGEAVRADHTVTFTCAKPGHFAGDGALCCGELHIAQIGIPRDLTDCVSCETFAVTKEDVDGWIPRRPRDAHKGVFGKLLILAGCVGYTGAPILASRAAVRAGAGLVSLGVPSAIYRITAVRCDEVMPFPLPCDAEGKLDIDAELPIRERLKQNTVCLLGPGLGRSPALTELVSRLVAAAEIPLVLDADGINAVSDNIHVLAGAKFPPVLTPHDGEFARLGGILTGGDRLGAARAFARRHGVILVLKGHRTITALPDGRAFLNTSGNPGLAKGGSGDVLSGILAALLGQRIPPEAAVPAAVWLHGSAGDLCARELGEYGMTPSDLIRTLPYVMKDY
jgi:NAD(P)H-hydrate epimerase